MRYLFILSLFVSFNGFSQQEPLNSFYWNNYSFFNPAMSGVKHKHEANVTWRNQWDKVNGAPNTLFVNYGMNLAEKHGIGFNFVHDAIGFTRSNQVKVNYNYQLKLDEDRKLVMGTAVGLQNLKINTSWVAPETQNDPSLPGSFSDYKFNFDLGVAYYGKQITVGIGATQLPPRQSASSSNGSLPGVITYNTATHVYGNFRYEASVSASSKLIFETQARTDFVKYSQDINIGYNWKNIIEARIGYRTSDAIIFNLTGIIAKNYRIGYSYDLTINKLINYSRGSHEITLGLRLPN